MRGEGITVDNAPNMSLVFALVLGQTTDAATPKQLMFTEVRLPDGTPDKNAPNNVWQEYTSTYTPWMDSGYYANKLEMPEAIRVPWATKSVKVTPPAYKFDKGIPADPHGQIFSYIRDTPDPSEVKPEVQILRSNRQRVTFGNRFQSFIIEQRHHMVEVRTIKGKRFQREKWWTTFALYSAAMACNEDFDPATGLRTKRS
jgi:hypothetical protein